MLLLLPDHELHRHRKRHKQKDPNASGPLYKPPTTKTRRKTSVLSPQPSPPSTSEQTKQPSQLARKKKSQKPLPNITLDLSILVISPTLDEVWKDLHTLQKPMGNISMEILIITATQDGQPQDESIIRNSNSSDVKMRVIWLKKKSGNTTPKDECDLKKINSDAYKNMYNIGATYANGKWLLFVPSFAMISTNWIQNTFDKLTEREDPGNVQNNTGVFACRVHQLDDEVETVHSAGVEAFMTAKKIDGKLAELAEPVNRFEGINRRDRRLLHDEVVNSPSPLCFLVSRSIFFSVGGLGIKTGNSNLKEEAKLWSPQLLILDFSMRLHQLGLLTRYLATEEAIMVPKDKVNNNHYVDKSCLIVMVEKKASEWWEDDRKVVDKFEHVDEGQKAFYSLWNDQLYESIWDKRVQLFESPDLPPVDIIWDPYGGCTGFGIESMSFIYSLEKVLPRVGVVADGGTFCHGYPSYIAKSAQRAALRAEAIIEHHKDNSQLIKPKNHRTKHNKFVWVSHKPMDAYPHFPYYGLVRVEKKPDYIIGRSMVETTEIPYYWPDCAADVDRIWVPSSFLTNTFAAAGIPKNKLKVVPIPIDTHFYDPYVVEPLQIDGFRKPAFTFLSIFKFEERKGVEFLLRAYWEEFSSDDDVSLVILTYLFDVPNDMKRNEGEIVSRFYAQANEFGGDILQRWEDGKLPHIQIITEELKMEDMPKLYKTADAFVLPTRGEGFGMPIQEAMAMELCAIATNWSGPSDFLLPEFSFPIGVELMEDALSFQGQWARPSVSQLRSAMRTVFEFPDEARLKGKLARQFVVDNFSQETMARKVGRKLAKHVKKQ